VAGGARDGTVLLAGATGLVGGLAVPHLLAPGGFERVVAVVRRPGPSVPGLEWRVVDFARLQPEPTVAATAAVCALGTTIAKAGSREAFPLMLGPLRRYRAVAANAVAAAAARAARDRTPGRFTWEYDAILGRG